jgi:hypothetical protein
MPNLGSVFLKSAKGDPACTFFFITSAPSESKEIYGQL